MRVWRYLDEVARSGSVRQAAERLHVTPSAVLRRIQDVEADIGEPLFERTGSGMMLTIAGELFIDWIRRQNADLETVQSQIAEISGVRRGNIRIACSQAVCSSFLSRQIAEFQKNHIDVVFSVQTSSHERAMRLLTQYEVDLALIFGPPVHPDLHAVISVGQRVVAVMRAGHPIEKVKVLRLRQCLDYPLALLDKSFAGRLLIDRAILATSRAGNIVVEGNSFEMLADYVRNSDAITFQVDIGTSNHSIDESFAVRPLSDDDEVYAPLVLLHLKGRALPLAAKRFADKLSARLHQHRMIALAQ